MSTPDGALPSADAAGESAAQLAATTALDAAFAAVPDPTRRPLAASRLTTALLLTASAAVANDVYFSLTHRFRARLHRSAYRYDDRDAMPWRRVERSSDDRAYVAWI